jgi:SAM-dependent methyltransferase
VAGLATAKYEVAVGAAIANLEQRWLPEPHGIDGLYGYVPLPLSEFLSGITSVDLSTPGSFLDVGCGLGVKLVIMRSLGWRVAGIDIHQPYLDAAAELCPDADLTCADLRDTQSFDVDFVFMFRPAIDDAMERECETHLLERLEPGTVLFLAGERLIDPGEYGGLPVGDQVWRMNG